MGSSASVRRARRLSLSPGASCLQHYCTLQSMVQWRSSTAVDTHHWHCVIHDCVHHCKHQCTIASANAPPRHATPRCILASQHARARGGMGAPTVSSRSYTHADGRTGARATRAQRRGPASARVHDSHHSADNNVGHLEKNDRPFIIYKATPYQKPTRMTV